MISVVIFRCSLNRMNRVYQILSFWGVNETETSICQRYKVVYCLCLIVYLLGYNIRLSTDFQLISSHYAQQIVICKQALMTKASRFWAVLGKILNIKDREDQNQ